jgi:branched-chain amino acid transport system permease protein
MTAFLAGRARMAGAAVGAAGLVLLAILPPSLPAYVVIVLTECLIYAMAAGSLDLLIGYTGMASLGHAAFFAVGAYTTALLTTGSRASFAVALAASILLAAATSAAVGVLVLRASGIYFMMITLSVSMCAWGLAYRWVSLTGGDTGIVSIPRPRLGFVTGGLEFYYATLVLFSVCLALYLLLVSSPFGKTLVGIRDSESRMRVLGFNVWLHKYLALVIAGGFAGLAGSLYAYYNGFVGPNTVDLAHSMQFVLMVIVGGPGTLVGPVIGAFIVTLLEKAVSVFTERWVMVLAAVYVVTALWAPRGLLGVLGVVRR